ncbi:YadA-like family protein [Paraburkholderia sp. SIMBA_030]|uniref:YadA-like family protein n=1 Tax=Paraburkholderia sp. SIMBA_030 TaxID=3085773 RepID=UPI0039789801
MNKIYKSVWCEATGMWVATSETARSKTKRGVSRKLALAQVVLAGAALAASVSAAHADPQSAEHYFSVSGLADGSDDAIAVADMNAIAAGPTATAGALNSIAIGNAARALNSEAIALGTNTVASGAGSVAIGVQGKATGANGVAIGTLASAQGSASTAVGESANASGDTSVALGSSATASGIGSSAFGAGSTASADGSVALGQGSIADRVNTVSVGSAGSERQITNVAAGTADTDAVNVAQLKEVTAQTDARLDGAVMYDRNADGSVNRNSVTLGDATSGGAVIHNVADGVDATDAVNLGQLNAAIGNAVQNIIVNPNVPLFSADGNTATEAAQASGTHSVAVGANANATGTNAIAVGANAVASGNNATSLGAAANASADNSVALGRGSVADRANTVSVGAAGQERQITNVADGVQGTDAVNVNQLQQSASGAVGQARRYTDDQIRSARRDSYGGTASALAAAGLPQAVLPGHGMVAIAGGTYGGQSAMAVGVSQLSETGKWVYKVQGTTDSRGQFGASVGAGMHW